MRLLLLALVAACSWAQAGVVSAAKGAGLAVAGWAIRSAEPARWLRAYGRITD